MMMCKQAEQGVPLQAKQAHWLADTDEEIDEQELGAHYSFMAKIQKVQLKEKSKVFLGLKAKSIQTISSVSTPNARHIWWIIPVLIQRLYNSSYSLLGLWGGKAKRSSFKLKVVPSSKGRLNLLHMDLCGPMRVASINGRNTIWFIVDDFSRFHLDLFLYDPKMNSRVLKDVLMMISTHLQLQVISVPTDKGTKFLNKTLHTYFKEEGIEHQTSTPRTPEQNDVVERRNRTLVKAGRTMLSASKLPLSFWAEAVATVCYTQNRSIIISTHGKTAYHIINDRKALIKHLHIFGFICYITRDGENLDKMKRKRGIHVSWWNIPTQSKGYRLVSIRELANVEYIHIKFDESKELTTSSSRTKRLVQIMTLWPSLRSPRTKWLFLTAEKKDSSQQGRGKIGFRKNHLALVARFGKNVRDFRCLRSTQVFSKFIGIWNVKTEKILMVHEGGGLCLSSEGKLQEPDVDRAGCIDTRKSTSGGIQFLGDKLVSWMSKKQNCSAMSSAEAEYVALLQVRANMGIMPTKIELTLEQSQQGASNDVLNSRKYGASLSLDDEEEEEITEEETIFFPFSLLGFIEMFRGSMTCSWNVKLAGTEFLNKTLHAYFAKEGIRHETSTARTPEQNGVVERRNRTLVEAARTMLSATKVPLFFWAEAIATACFTQNRSLVIPRHEKTPYHIINARKPLVKFFHIFGSLCYIVRDGENLDKMKEKGDACIFVRYSTQSKAYMVFNKRTRMIVEIIHVNFDELPQMASDRVSSDPGPQCSTTVVISSAAGHQKCRTAPQCSLAEAEYVVVSACCAQVLWVENSAQYYSFHFDKKYLRIVNAKAAIAIISCNPVQISVPSTSESDITS
ncbi:retrovirus-related pol polyprotein from transposon TNT 1-94 [Tanacetum coccineum]|uniref:Retrovirus-related pol polyprotein from transposon TNT 1-94 n=1 Tax=Tanacetum coccineum TaxID=301880 RepID=A0ABQ5D2J3_9ASTR